MKTRRLLAAAAIASGLATTATALPAAAAPAQAYTYNYGAIAYDWNEGVAYAVDYPSARAAKNAAMRRCGRHCGYFTFYNSCGAVAYGYSGGRTHIGRAHGYPSRAAAQRAAKSQVPGRSHIRVWACTTR